MGSVPVTTDGPGELKYVMRDVLMEDRDGPVGGRNCVYEGNGSRSNVVADNVIQRVNGAVQAQSGSQLRHQPRVSAVCWERYLPRRSLKVLLVEGDDSTRHVVSALLRNCGYEVTATTDGLQAWSILMDMTNHIDLVLTEVDMPYLSGIGLLCKVMSHKTCMNIPVIMMSSNDPIILVLKCLSKGAVDFLVKPIRKNELKNLWQHVWRKYYSCSDSDSASESGIHVQKSRKEKNAAESVHNTYCSNGNENGCIDLNVRDGSDSGSGTQSTCIKQAVEIDKPPTMLPRNASVFPADSTCAQFIDPRGEADGNDPMTATMTRCQKMDARIKANIAMGKDLEITVPRTQEIKHKYESEKVSRHLTCTKQDQLSAQEPKKENKQLRNNVLDLQSDKPIDELKEQAAGIFCLTSNATNPLDENVLQVTDRKSNSGSYLNKAISPDSNLKRPRGIGDIGSSNYDDRNVPIRSPISSFSRYNNVSTSKNVTSGKVGSCTPVSNSGAARSQLMNSFPSNSNRTPDQGWNDNSTNNKEIGSITGDVLPRLAGSKVKSTSIMKFQKSSFFPPMQNGHTYSSEKIIPQKVVSTRGEDQQVQVQHHHHHHHYYHHHMHEVQEEQSHSYDEDMQLEKIATVSMQCGSSNVISQAVEGSDRKYSSNGSGSGSKHGSNAPNGSNTDVNAGEADIKSENMVTGESGNCFGRGIENRRGINTARYRTESAIQKRKEKCFIKKADSKSGRS